MAGYVANENQRSSSHYHYARENHEEGYHPFQGCCEENGHFSSPLLPLFRAKLPAFKVPFYGCASTTDVKSDAIDVSQFSLPTLVFPIGATGTVSSPSAHFSVVVFNRCGADSE